MSDFIEITADKDTNIFELASEWGISNLDSFQWPLGLDVTAGVTFRIPIKDLQVQPLIPPEMFLPENAEAVEGSTSSYLYADQYAEEGLGAEIDASIIKNMIATINKHEALSTATIYAGQDIENLSLHAFMADEVGGGDPCQVYRLR